jgi:hypothetical protein
MKNKITLIAFSFFLISSISFAQKKVEASNIMKDIKEGKSISINNATIVGVLDFTYMDNALEKLPNKKKNSWFNWSSSSSSNEIKKMIDVKVSFTNCTFKDDVLAYIPDEDSGYTFTASFEDIAIFKNCEFERKAMFKYSRFERNSDFSGSSFNDDSTFKYAKFDKNISFENTTFDEIATFKYAKFNNNVSFYNAVFKDSATFKYTNFSDGVSFKNAKFEEDLNIKYMKVSGDFNITNMNVSYDIDSKYTKINGKSFSKYLIDKK